MKKSFFWATVLMLGVWSQAALANNFESSSSSNEDGIPEKNGTYNVPGHPGIKVKVFVHQPKKNFPTMEENLSSCGLDEDSNWVVGKLDYYLPQGTWKYLVNVSGAPSTVGSNMKNMTESSFAQWQGTGVQTAVSFVDFGTTALNKAKLDKKNIVAFGKTAPSTLGVTYTWYTSDGLVVENDTILNAKVAWFLNQCSTAAYDAQGILTHEIGHWLGLSDHYTSEYFYNTMYGYGDKGEDKDRTLTTGDISGVQLIYSQAQ